MIRRRQKPIIIEGLEEQKIYILFREKEEEKDRSFFIPFYDDLDWSARARINKTLSAYVLLL